MRWEEREGEVGRGGREVEEEVGIENLGAGEVERRGEGRGR